MSTNMTHLDELDRIAVGEHGLLWRPIRQKLGIEYQCLPTLGVSELGSSSAVGGAVG